MNCELCGKDTGYLKNVIIEQSTLKVCPQCMKFGKIAPAPPPDRGSVGGTGPAAPRRAYARDVFTEDGRKELVLDYPERIKSARLGKGWTPEEFGKVINERKSIITKLESGELRPDKKLTSKLEKKLNISLMGEVEETEVKVKKKKSRPRLLGDIIKIE